MKRALLAAILVCLAPQLALAGKNLDQAQAAFDSLAVDEAQPLFEKALLEPATREERIKAWKGLGLSLAFMADAKGAQDAFERLLLIDPEAKVDTALGPRVTKPFDAAKKAMRGKRAAFKVERQSKTGEVKAALTDPMGLTSEVRLHWRVHGKKSFELVKGTDATAKAATPPEKDVEVYVQALDPQGGVLFEDGTESAFNSLPAVVREPEKQPEAVASAVKEAKQKSGRRPADEEVTTTTLEEDESGGGSSWPLYLGAAVVVVGGGAAAAYLFTRPPELTMSPADRTAQLPWRF